MTTIDAILRCDGDVEVYELLNGYIRAAHLSEHTNGAAPDPLANVMDVMQTMRALFIQLGWVSRRLDDESRISIKEALSVFNVALDRLRALAMARQHTSVVRDARRQRTDSVYFAQHGRRRVDGASHCSAG